MIRNILSINKIYNHHPKTLTLNTGKQIRIYEPKALENISAVMKNCPFWEPESLGELNDTIRKEYNFNKDLFVLKLPECYGQIYGHLRSDIGQLNDYLYQNQIEGLKLLKENDYVYMSMLYSVFKRASLEPELYLLDSYTFKLCIARKRNLSSSMGVWYAGVPESQKSILMVFEFTITDENDLPLVELENLAFYNQLRKKGYGTYILNELKIFLNKTFPKTNLRVQAQLESDESKKLFKKVFFDAQPFDKEKATLKPSYKRPINWFAFTKPNG